MRFAVLEHDHPFLHWDLLLEWGEVARTWRLLVEPVDDAVTDGVAAEPLADHRVMYLEYEGPVSGDRGTVKPWDAGTFEVVHESDGELALEFAGHQLIGRFTLQAGGVDRAATFQRSAASEG